MRDVIVICRSTGRARPRTASVLDRYFQRIGDRTWRGRASNACLDRVCRELRKTAKRNTAVVIHEIRSAAESRRPIVRIGSRTKFDEDGVAPVAVRPSRRQARRTGSETIASALAVVRIAALFHDLGKATNLFQQKLRHALTTGENLADAVRHELVSAVIWERLTEDLSDAELIARLETLTSEEIDRAWEDSISILLDIHARAGSPESAICPSFAKRPDSLAGRIGLLILTHHRLVETSSSFRHMRASAHVMAAERLDRPALAIAPGIPFWHEISWRQKLERAVRDLQPERPVAGTDMALRASLMLADHFGSSCSQASEEIVDHLANTRKPDGRTPAPADSLSRHVSRVHAATRHAFGMLHNGLQNWPGFEENEMPIDISLPHPGPERFRWQHAASVATKQLCGGAEGGFFGCIIAGTGTGKTRGAPTILSAAAFADTRPERRLFRMSLCLGLRTLATQSAAEYTNDLGFSGDAVSVLVGQEPVRFDGAVEDDGVPGSESLIKIPEWLRVEEAGRGVPVDGSGEEHDWIAGLSLNTERRLPAFCDRAIGLSKDRGKVNRLLSAPVMIGTIDHLMAVAEPVRSSYLHQFTRVRTSDLILDEVDQYGPEDLAAICRLVFQSGASGRRVVAMSATLPEDIVNAMFAAYRAGWSEYARMFDVTDSVNVLCTGDAPGSTMTEAGAASIEKVYRSCRAVVSKSLEKSPPLRCGQILEPDESWTDVVETVARSCSSLHETHHVEIGGYRVSCGLVRLTRISHTAAMAHQLPAGALSGRLRLKICLHSAFPRLHRSWIETLLKQALTRKGDVPSAGLSALCERFGVFERASEAGIQDIEIVVVASPVIETGNDVDFDWAIVDPVSPRSVIQSAGRVRRHRRGAVEAANVHILGRCAVAMETGRIARPGIETDLPKETGVSRGNLDSYPGRLTRDLMGADVFDVITSRPILDPRQAMPLREAETAIRKKMIVIEDSLPSAAYLQGPLARLSWKMPKMRKFRRSTARDIAYFLQGDAPCDAEWMIDLAPGTKQSAPYRAIGRGLETMHSADDDGWFFKGHMDAAWDDLLGLGSTPSGAQVEDLMSVRISQYGGEQLEFFPDMCYYQYTGFTRGSSEDLFRSFGNR